VLQHISVRIILGPRRAASICNFLQTHLSVHQPVSARKPVPGPLPDRASCVTEPSPTVAMARDHAAVSFSACRLPAHGAGVGRHGRPASASPQRALLLPVCRRPGRGSVLHACTRVHQSQPPPLRRASRVARACA
jgi:hypothetical protein